MSLTDFDSLYSSQLITAAPAASSSALQVPSTPIPHLRLSLLALFSYNLYTRRILNTIPSKMRYVCTQPNCPYFSKPTLLNNNISGNLWKHYYAKHPELTDTYKDGSTVVSSSSITMSTTTSRTPRFYTSQLLPAQIELHTVSAALSQNSTSPRCLKQLTATPY